MTGRLMILLAAAAVLVACDEKGGSIEGSLSDVYDLTFESIRARLYETDLSIEYVNAEGEVVVRLTDNRARMEPAPGAVVDLMTQGDITGTSGGVTIPRITKGTMKINRFMPYENARITGSFEAVFLAGTNELSLSGDFAVRIEVVPPK